MFSETHSLFKKKLVPPQASAPSVRDLGASGLYPKGRRPPPTYNSIGYPIRIGVEDCRFFTRSGRCDFGHGCMYNHPEEKIPKNFALNELGLPLRPGAETCPFFFKSQTCAY